MALLHPSTRRTLRSSPAPSGTMTRQGTVLPRISTVRSSTGTRRTVVT